MTEHEEIQLRQESTINKLRAEVAELKAQNNNLRNMHRNDQRHIGKLQAQLEDSAFDRAEVAFRGTVR